MPWCTECNRRFVNGLALQQHLNTAAVHRPVYNCGPCCQSFPNERALERHEEYSMKHLRNICTYVCEPCRWGCNKRATFENHEVEVHHWCKTHDRYFQNANNLRQHLASREHGTPMTCPYCDCGFPTVQAVAAHMESGSCEGGMNRLKVDRRVRAGDRNGVITNQRLIGYGDWEEPDVWATDEAWNGDGYECYFCNKEYTTLGRLNAHITRWHTERTKQNLYKCPRPVEDCGRQFNQFSHLMGHLEHSSTCGVKGDRRIMRQGARLLLN